MKNTDSEEVWFGIGPRELILVVWFLSPVIYSDYDLIQYTLKNSGQINGSVVVGIELLWRAWTQAR